MQQEGWRAALLEIEASGLAIIFSAVFVCTIIGADTF
jgi:hypothetical protein